MTPSTLLKRWPSHIALIISLTVVLVGCSNVPRKYLRMAEPGVTLSELSPPGHLSREGSAIGGHDH